MSTTADYNVRGMTCAHCVASVSKEVSAIPGVTDVWVDLPTGDLRITSKEPVPVEAVQAAVDEAGYTLAR